MENKLIDFFEELRNSAMGDKAVEEIFNARSNPEKLKKDYNEYLEIVEGVKSYERNRLKTFLLADQNAEAPKKEKIRKLPGRKKWFVIAGIAASILLLAIPVYSLLFFPNDVYQTFNLNEYAGSELGEVRTKNPSVSEFDAYVEALKMKQQGNYAEALKIFNSIEQEALLVKAKYHAALIHVKMRNYTEAKKELLEIIARPDDQHYLKEPAGALLDVLNRSKIRFLYR